MRGQLQPPISVSITCYNHDRFIRQCVDSVLSQTYPACDIHVIDDCSTDGSLEILRSYGDKIRLTTRDKNHGVAGYTTTINQEIRTAPGDFWYRLDSDDFIEPDYFEAMVSALRNEPELDWICGGLNVVRADGTVTDQWDYTSWSTERTAALQRAWQTCSVPLPHNGIFRLDFLRNNNLFWECFPYGWGADVLFTIRALQAGVRARLIPGYLFNWRTHGNNASCDIDRRIGLVIAVKEYFAEKLEPELYLNLPSANALPDADRRSLIRLLQAGDLLTAKRQFRIPAMFSAADTTAKLHAALPQCDATIERWLGEARSLSSRYAHEANQLERTLTASKAWVDGEVSFDAGEYERALESARTSLQNDPQFFESLRLQADALVALGLLEAEQAISQVVALAPTDQRALNTAAVFLAGKGESEQAFALLCKSAANGPSLEPRLNLLELAPEICSQRLTHSTEKDRIIEALASLADRVGKTERSEIVAEQHELRQHCLDQFHHRYRDRNLRLLLHLPPNGALKYLFQSWADMLNHIGITTQLLPWGVDFSDALTQFKPNVLISVADPAFVAEIELNTLAAYKRKNDLTVGWVTTLAHSYEPVDFYLTFHLDPKQEPTFLTLDKPLISVPFAANPLRHIAVDLPILWDYFFVGTNSMNKIAETAAYLEPILNSSRGILAGVGWNKGLGEVTVDQATLLYQAAKISPNFHMQGQLDRYNELNERCYIVPALGCFQIVDKAKALATLFAPDELVVAVSPADYQRLFAYFLEHADERNSIARRGMQRVWRQYTLGHVLDRLAAFLIELPAITRRSSRSEIVAG